VNHSRDYRPVWRTPGIIRLKKEPGRKPQIYTKLLDIGTSAWVNYTRRAIDHWPFAPEELQEFAVLAQRGDFPMMLKTDPNAAPHLNAPLFTNANNGKFWEVTMPVSWRPQFGNDFAAKREEALRLAKSRPWRSRKSVAVWRGVIGCATGCGPRGPAYFPNGTLQSCLDDKPASNWNANAVGATWGCGDDAEGTHSTAWREHSRVKLVSSYAGARGERCGIDAAFHAFNMHGAWLRQRTTPGEMQSWMKDRMDDEETAKHKYVFHVGNNGYSDRSWRMFALGNLVLLVDNGWQEFYFPLLQPWVHYIPVQADAGDACERVAWARAHPRKAERIAQNGRNFVEFCLTESFIDLYVAEMVRQLGRLWKLGKEKR